MAIYRKKPVTIEARQFDGTWPCAQELWVWMGRSEANYLTIEATLVIDTLEGIMFASAGDWIIKGVKGEFYPCKPDIFEAIYEPV